LIWSSAVRKVEKFMIALPEKIRAKLGRRGRVTEVEMLTRRMKRIRFADESLRYLDWQPGQHLRVQVDSFLRLGDAVRTYSIWQYQPNAGIIDLVILLHGRGPGSRWAAALQPGALVTFFGPSGKFILEPGARYHLFAGEETGAVAIQAMLRALPSNAEVYGCLEADTAADPLPTVNHALDWVYREGKPASPASGLVTAVRKLELPSYPGVAYLAGETKTCLALRNYLLKERGWPARNIRTKPFWEEGKTGLE
jgi:NADPH-dependent ferric siderophore reductase